LIPIIALADCGVDFAWEQEKLEASLPKVALARATCFESES
jgi:hypothetical protein